MGSDVDIEAFRQKLDSALDCSDGCKGGHARGARPFERRGQMGKGSPGPRE